jgi:DNA-binding HxlR family transcriptional regulator
MWELLSFIQGQTRKICLKELANGPKTPAMIAKSSQVHLSHISRALRELVEKGIAECVTPDTSKNRFYRLTDLGKNLMQMLEEIEAKTPNKKFKP